MRAEVKYLNAAPEDEQDVVVNHVMLFEQNQILYVSIDTDVKWPDTTECTGDNSWTIGFSKTDKLPVTVHVDLFPTNANERRKFVDCIPVPISHRYGRLYALVPKLGTKSKQRTLFLKESDGT